MVNPSNRIHFLLVIWIYIYLYICICIHIFICPCINLEFENWINNNNMGCVKHKTGVLKKFAFNLLCGRRTRLVMLEYFKNACWIVRKKKKKMRKTRVVLDTLRGKCVYGVFFFPYSSIYIYLYLPSNKVIDWFYLNLNVSTCIYPIVFCNHDVYSVVRSSGAGFFGCLDLRKFNIIFFFLFRVYYTIQNLLLKFIIYEFITRLDIWQLPKPCDIRTWLYTVTQ